MGIVNLLERYGYLMTIFEPVPIAFIVRFWLEQRETERVAPVWRGVVEHVPSGERHYFLQIEDLPGIMAPYLKNKDASHSANND